MVSELEPGFLTTYKVSCLKYPPRAQGESSLQGVPGLPGREVDGKERHCLRAGLQMRPRRLRVAAGVRRLRLGDPVQVPQLGPLLFSLFSWGGGFPY